jgi:hypothetical protein
MPAGLTKMQQMAWKKKNAAGGAPAAGAPPPAAGAQLPRRASGRQAPEGAEQDRRVGGGARARPRLRRVPRNAPAHNEVVFLSPHHHHRGIPAVKQGAVGRNDGTALAHPRRATSRPPAACTWPPHLPRPRRLERPARERTERPGAPAAPTAAPDGEKDRARQIETDRATLGVTGGGGGPRRGLSVENI